METQEVTKLSQEAVRQYVIDKDLPYNEIVAIINFLKYFDLLRN